MNKPHRKTSALSVGLTVNWPRSFFAIALFVAFGGIPRTAAQDSQKPSNAEEMSGRETQPTFTIRAERNLVLVRVIVRDSKGKAVTGLGKEDFQLFDNGKPQTISEFNIESPVLKAHPPSATATPAQSAAPGTVAEKAAVLPERFVALYFDDVHLQFEDTVRTRDAAKKYLRDALQPGDRAAVFTSSEHLTQDFTADRDKLIHVLDQVQLRPRISQSLNPCPDISPYQAHQINEQQPDAIGLAVADLIDCQCQGDARACVGAAQQVEGLARQVLETDEMQSRYSLRALESLVRHLAGMPGQRDIVFVSPGFFSDNLKFELNQVVDRALRARVIINTLDAKGLVALVPGGDASRRTAIPPAFMNIKIQFDRQSLEANSDVLAQLAAETGGVFFENNNDYDAGFLKTGALPETTYVLAFSPTNLKLDGSFHKLKVKLANPAGLSTQSRRGYFAPRKAEDAATREKEDIEEAVFSRDELREMPLNVNTQFFKTDSLNAKLSVVAHVDISSIHFRKEEERNLDNLTLAAALFDSDGNFVTGSETTLQMRLRDVTLDQATHSGIFMKTSLLVKAGTYMMRVVVRDTQSTRMSALSETVEIPY